MRAAAAVSALLAVACSDEVTSPEVVPSAPRCELAAPLAGPEVTEDGSLRWTAEGGARLELRPRARIGGEWLGSACSAIDGGVRCTAGSAGAVDAIVRDDGVALVFCADGEVELEGLALAGQAFDLQPRAWLSNGFQSWSNSGWLALPEAPSEAALAAALAARGDVEVVRKGTELSWWYSAVAGRAVSLFAGATAATSWRSWVRASRGEGGALDVWLGQGAAGDVTRVPAAACPLSEEAWRIELGADPQCLLERYGRALASRRAGHPVAAEAGWNSWYELWDDVDDAAVRENAPLARAALADRVGPDRRLRIVVDDGWQKAWGDWEPNTKFRGGMDALAAELRADGFEPGIWLAPLLVHRDLPLVADHPEWLVADAEFLHLGQGTMRVLDVTHPGAADHLQATVRRLVGWGFSLLKIDFLFAGTFVGGRHDEVTAMHAYRRALSLIREAAGEQTVLLAVGAPGLPTFPYADAWRLGPDIAFATLGPQWPFLLNEARSVGARFAECYATLCDADPPLLRGLDRDEVDIGAWVVAFAGGALFLSDDLRRLPEERLGWVPDGLQAGLSLGGVPSQPLELFPERVPDTLVDPLSDLAAGGGKLVAPSKWRLPDGRRVLLNASAAARTLYGVEVPAHAARLAEAD